MYLSEDAEKFLDFEEYDGDFFLPFKSVKRAKQVPKKFENEEERFPARIEVDCREAWRKKEEKKER